MTDDELEYRIGKLILEPGDVLVAKFDGLGSDDLMRRIHEHAARIVGRDTKVLVIDSRLDLSVLTRAEIESRAAHPAPDEAVAEPNENAPQAE